jgi:hypothetical protein
MYPNPANDEIFIKGLESNEKVFYRLINSSGMEMSSGYTSPANSISTKDFLSGIYTLTILDKNRIVHQRLLIIHP